MVSLMETTDVHLQVVTWIEDGRIHLRSYIRLFIILKSWSRVFMQRGNACSSAISMVILESKTFLCTVAIIRKAPRRQDYFHIYFQSSVRISLLSIADLAIKRAKNQQRELVFIRNWGHVLISSLWKVHSLAWIWDLLKACISLLKV